MPLLYVHVSHEPSGAEGCSASMKSSSSSKSLYRSFETRLPLPPPSPPTTTPFSIFHPAVPVDQPARSLPLKRSFQGVAAWVTAVNDVRAINAAIETINKRATTKDTVDSEAKTSPNPAGRRRRARYPRRRRIDGRPRRTAWGWRANMLKQWRLKYRESTRRRWPEHSGADRRRRRHRPRSNRALGIPTA